MEVTECSPFPCGEYQSVVFHAGTPGLSVPGPRARWLTDTSPCVLWLFVPSSGLISIYRAVFSMSWTCRKENTVQEYESSWGRGGSPPRASDGVKRDTFAALLLNETLTPEVLSQAWLSFYSGKAPSKVNCYHLCPLSSSQSPGALLMQAKTPRGKCQPLCAWQKEGGRLWESRGG